MNQMNRSEEKGKTNRANRQHVRLSEMVHPLIGKWRNQFAEIMAEGRKLAANKTSADKLRPLSPQQSKRK